MKIRIGAGYSIESVVSDLSFRIVENMRFDNLQIGEAINTNDIINIALNTDGVVTVVSMKEDIIFSRSNADEFLDVISEEILTYNETSFSPLSSYEDGFIFPARGGIFEMKHPNFDIVGRIS